MGQPIVHFEIIGKDPERLRSYYGDLFGWEFDTNAPVAEVISQPGNYGFVDRNTTSDGTEIPGGVGGGVATRAPSSFTSAFLTSRRRSRRPRASAGRVEWVPKRTRRQIFVVGHFTDPEGHLIGLAGPA